MTTESNAGYLDAWWSQKLDQKYGVQWKHIAAAQLLSSNHFPMVDLGAGAGVFLKLIEERFPGVAASGVEISETAIKNKMCSSPIVQGDLASWKAVGRVSTVSLIDVVEHIADPEPLLKSVASFSDYLVLACPNFNYLKARWDVLRGNVPFQNRVGRGGHVYWCQYDSLIRLFEMTGFSVIGENHIYPKNGNSILRRIFGWWPSLFAHEFVFIVRVRA